MRMMEMLNNAGECQCLPSVYVQINMTPKTRLLLKKNFEFMNMS